MYLFSEVTKVKINSPQFQLFENIKEERILITYFDIKSFAFFLNSSLILKSFSGRMSFDVHCSGSTDGIGIVNVFVAILQDILADFFDGSCVDSR